MSDMVPATYRFRMFQRSEKFLRVARSLLNVLISHVQSKTKTENTSNHFHYNFESSGTRLSIKSANYPKDVQNTNGYSYLNTVFLSQKNVSFEKMCT